MASEGSEWFTSLHLLPNYSLPRRNNPDRMPPACMGVPDHAYPWHCILVLKSWLVNLAGKALSAIKTEIVHEAKYLPGSVSAGWLSVYVCDLTSSANEDSGFHSAVFGHGITKALTGGLYN